MSSVTETEAEALGYASFNPGPHLCVDVPDGNFTISARTSTGRRITFGFTPYRENGPAQCVDIVDHDGETVLWNGCDTPVSDVLLLPGGRTSYDSRKLPTANKPMITVLLIEDKK